MSVSLLVVDDEPDVADLFRLHFRRKVQAVGAEIGRRCRLPGAPR